MVRSFSVLPQSQETRSAWDATFHTDLAPLLRDDPETDFFNNMSHIQVHRRARALNRLRKVLSPDADEPLSLTSSTLVHVLLPLASQPLSPQSTQPKAVDPNLLHEAILTTAEVARQLSWSHYHKLVNRFLRMIGMLGTTASTAVEKASVNGLCAVLDAFHFTVEPPRDDEKAVAEEQDIQGDDEEEDEEGKQQPSDQGSAKNGVRASGSNGSIWRDLTVRLIPGVRSLLMRDGTDKEGGKIQTLRASMALALLKIIRFLPTEMVSYQLNRLLMVVCGALRSRESNTREAARTTLCKMVVDMGPSYLSAVLHHVTAQLREGYQLHIRTYTIHAILLALSGSYSPPDAPSMPLPKAIIPGHAETIQDKNGEPGVEPVQPPLDACIPGLMELLVDDIFGGSLRVNEDNGETANTKSSSMKEAKGQHGIDTIEVLAKCLLFRPTYAVARPDNPASISSVHAVVTPLLWKIHDSEATNVHGKQVQIDLCMSVVL